MRGPDARVLYGERHEKEKKNYIEEEASELDNKRPFFYKFFDGKPFVFTTEKDRVSIQIHVILTFSKNCCELRDLGDHGTQVGVLKGHCASLADSIWSRERITVSIVIFGHY